MTLATLQILLVCESGSGVTTDPADPAMRGGPRAYGGPTLWHWFFFHWKFNTTIFVRTRAAM